MISETKTMGGKMTVKEQVVNEIDTLPEEGLKNVLEFVLSQKYRLNGNGKNTRIFTIEEIKEKITPIAERYGVKKTYLFGSYARGEAGPESDIDICIEEGKIRTLFEFAGFSADLEEQLGTKIDVVSYSTLDGEFKEEFEKDGVLIYG